MSQPHLTRNHTRPGLSAEPAAVLDERSESNLSESEEVEILRGENAALRAKADELDQLLALAAQDADERWAERQREYESLLEEKSEVIRALHHKIAELRDRAPAAAPVESREATPDRQELLRLKQELEEARAQIEHDETAMMAQMRQMEMNLAKDRAELARQRSELQRLHDDLKHELETASRDSGLRERLNSLQRRSSVTTSTPVRPNQDTPTPGQHNNQKSGLFRRIFGSNT